MLPGLLFSMRSLGLYGVSGGPWVRGAGRRAVASGSRARGRGGTEAYDEDRDTEERDPPEKLKALLQEELRRQKVIRFHRARRQMTPPGPPSRRLTWDAIQQIRYLKQEFPEEWTVERLAEGFSVSRDVIGRVLRSKFVPPAERRERQDARATSTAGQRAPPPALGSGEGRVGLLAGAKAMLAPGNGGAALTLVGGLDKVVAASRYPVGFNSRRAAAVPYEQRPLPHNQPSSPELESTAMGTKVVGCRETAEEEEDEEQRWDGTVLSDLQLEELAEQHKAHPRQDTVVRKGQEVFDHGGNFLYRI
ncbi:neugrin-like [Scleropages formosus]|uniref:Neugrin n=1 Tax=Scleropages formosus TaxID=113540 RepID=A0A0N8JZ79_SCLFO|nr:neugrin-like [Scleropages formosus]